jgi:hypothetical protein
MEALVHRLVPVATVAIHAGRWRPDGRNSGTTPTARLTAAIVCREPQALAALLGRSIRNPLTQWLTFSERQLS